MRRLFRYFLLTVLLLSCSPEAPITEVFDTESVGIRISAAEQTKATSNTEPFPRGGEVGVFLYKHGTNQAHSSSTSLNIRARKISNYWVYASNSGIQFLPTLSKKDGALDCFAYYPFRDWMKDLETIPLTNNINYMWAQGNGDTSASNLNVDLSQGDLINHVMIPLCFKHVMSQIVFKFRLTNQQSNVFVNNVYFKVLDEKNPLFYTKGTLNAKTGDVRLDEESKKTILEIRVGRDISISGVTELPTYILPSSIPKADLVQVQFKISNKMVSGSFYLPKVDFEAGKSYAVEVQIDNYCKIDKVNLFIDQEWYEGDHDLGVEL